MSGFQYFSQRSLRSSGVPIAIGIALFASLRALRETKTGHYPKRLFWGVR